MKKFMAVSKEKSSIDWGITVLPLIIVVIISALLMLFPKQAEGTLSFLRNIFVNKMGFFYIILGIGVLMLSIGLSFSKYGGIKFGAIDKPKYSNFSWGAMIFTSTMAADIVYWSLIEWSYYYSAKPFGMENMDLAQKQDMASAYPLFHWGPIPWAFYLLPACAYAYMFFVKKRDRQKLSEACRPILKNKADGKVGKTIDTFAIVGLLAGTATTFSLATPLLSEAIGYVFGIQPTRLLTIGILVFIGLVFVIAVMKGMKAISYLASACVIVFAVMIGCFILFGPKVYMIETGITAIGTVINDFFKMATWMDPLRLSSTGGNGFPQDWTIFYWAYWIAWFVATPFFIAKISEGRTIKQTILGDYLVGCWVRILPLLYLEVLA
jgi:BCCT family betaine/carnitine transporter